jgi:hypothetical protein
MTGNSESTEWSELSTRYFLDTAIRATRNTDLYLVLLNCAARQAHSGPPLDLREIIPGNSLAAHHAEEIAMVSARFFASLVQLTCASDAAPPEFTPADPAGWFGRLSNYTRGHGRRMLETMLDAACGDAASASELAHQDGARLLRFGRAYFVFLGEVARIGADIEEAQIRGMLSRAELLKRPRPMVELRAAIGETTSAELMIENTRNVRAVVGCRVPALRRADGVGPSFVPAITFHPGEFALEPLQEACVRLSLEVDAESYAPDSIYVGTVHLSRGSEPEVHIPFQVITRTDAQVSP